MDLSEFGVSLVCKSKFQASQDCYSEKPGLKKTKKKKKATLSQEDYSFEFVFLPFLCKLSHFIH